MFSNITFLIFILFLTVAGAIFSYLCIGRRSDKIFLYIFSFFVLHLAAILWELRPLGSTNHGGSLITNLNQIIAEASKLAFPVLAYGCFSSWKKSGQTKNQSDPIECQKSGSTVIWGGGLIVWSVFALFLGQYGRGGLHFTHNPLYWISPALLVVGVIVVVESISIESRPSRSTVVMGVGLIAWLAFVILFRQDPRLGIVGILLIAGLLTLWNKTKR